MSNFIPHLSLETLICLWRKSTVLICPLVTKIPRIHHKAKLLYLLITLHLLDDLLFPLDSGFSDNANFSNFLANELSPLSITDNISEIKPLNCHGTLRYGDPVTRQRFDFASEIVCNNNPYIVVAHESQFDQYYLSSPGPLKDIHSVLWFNGKP